MKIKILPVIICAVFTGYAINSHAQANKSLSNLTNPTSVNQSLIPSSAGSKDLGSSTSGWNNFYLSGIIFLNGGKFINNPILGGHNTAIGWNVLNSALSGASDNTGVGYEALYYNKRGFDNTALGSGSLYNNTKAAHNTAIGFQALYSDTTGYANTANGEEALYNNNGYYNTATGVNALWFNTTGSSNAANGYVALYQNTTGSLNTATGSFALEINTTGNNNTANGSSAGFSVTDGSNNTFVGASADCGSAGHITNGMALGYKATVTADNHIHVGNSSVTWIGGQVGWSNLSDVRIKNNIQENVPGLAFINLLRPVTYHYDVNKQEAILGRKTEDWKSKYDIEKIQFTGFIAQDVEAAAKKINYDFSGVEAPKNSNDLYSLRYSDFVVPLVKAVQELSSQNSVLKSQNESQQNQIEDLQNRIAKLEAMMNVSSQSAVNSQQSIAISSASLAQNVPNPFSNSTTINYSLSQQFSSAKIIITDKNGNAIKQINLSNNKGSVNVDASTLSSGAYQYSLYLDGKPVATKQMELLK
jgi:hypothetical protein